MNTKQLFAFTMTTAMTLAPFTNAFAADASGFDSEKKASLTIHKYDITGAEEAGAYQAGTYAATGQTDRRVEAALEGYGIKGVGFSYLKVGDAEMHSNTGTEGKEIGLVYELPQSLAEVLGLSASDAVDMADSGEGYPCSKGGVLHYPSEAINQAMANRMETGNIEAKNALEQYMADHNGSQMPMTDEEGFSQVTGLDTGLYLIVETSVPEHVTDTVNPWFAQLPFTDRDGSGWVYDMTCYPKDQTGNPTLDKSVRSADDTVEGAYSPTTTASEGDLLEYILVSKLPHITSEATYLSEYAFSDTLSKGLTYGMDAKIAIYTSAEAANSNRLSDAKVIWDTNSSCFTQTYLQADNSEDGNSHLKIEITEEGRKELNTLSDHYLTVSYTAALNSDAFVTLGDDGNPNDARLTWSRTSEDYFNTLEDRCYVYTYGLDLTKYFSDGQGDFAKVSFRLFNCEDQCYVTAEKEADGLYYVSGHTEQEKEATGFVPSASGKLDICGLEGDLYELTEVTTDAGYSLLKKPIQISIRTAERDIIAASVRSSVSDDGRTTAKTEMKECEQLAGHAEVDGKEAVMTENNAMVSLSVTNSKSFLLPQTGGNGLYAITILGILAAALGSGMVLSKKQK